MRGPARGQTPAEESKRWPKPGARIKSRPLSRIAPGTVLFADDDGERMVVGMGKRWLLAAGCWHSHRMQGPKGSPPALGLVGHGGTEPFLAVVFLLFSLLPAAVSDRIEPVLVRPFDPVVKVPMPRPRRYSGGASG